MTYFVVGQINELVDQVRLIATQQPYTGPSNILIWRSSDGLYWDQGIVSWVVPITYNVAPIYRGQGMYSFSLPAVATIGMDGDVVHWVTTDNPIEAAVTVISKGGEAKVLDGENLVRTMWTDTRASLLDNLSGTFPSVPAIADAVWDELRSGHTAAGSFGESIQDVLGSPVNIASSVWDELSASHTTASTMGRFLRDVFWSHYNRKKVDISAMTETVYMEDKVTPHKVFYLKDAAGIQAATNVFERNPV